MWNNPLCGKRIHFTIIKTHCDYKTQLVKNTPRVVTEVVTKVSSLRNEIWQKMAFCRQHIPIHFLE